MVAEFNRLQSLYAAQDANIWTAFVGALILILGYALLTQLRATNLSATLRRVYLSLVVGLDLTLLIVFMVVNWLG